MQGKRNKNITRRIIGTAAALSVLLGLVGCSIEGRRVPIASGSSSGAFYLQITPIAALWEQLDFVDSCSVQATTGALENQVLISTDDADAGLIDTFAYYAGMEGSEPYTEDYPGVLAIATGTPSLMTIVVRADSDIYSISDLAGHAISVGTPGSGAEFETRFLLEALGLSYDDFSRVDMVGIGPGFTAFQDGKTDAVIAYMGAGNSSLMEAMTNVDVRILSFTEEEMDIVLENCNYVVEDIIPGGSYDGFEEDIPTVSVPCMLAVRDDLPEDEVYEMTKIICENVDTLVTANGNFRLWSFGLSCSDIMPLHPGAERYYTETGMD